MVEGKPGSSWPLGMRPYDERVFPDVSRSRTMVDAYRNVYLYKDGGWDDLAAATACGGEIWRTYGVLCYYVPSSVSSNGTICYACFASGVVCVYAFDYAPTIVRFIDASPRMRS